jgi:polysaccharide deacetylase
MLIRFVRSASAALFVALLIALVPGAPVGAATAPLPCGVDLKLLVLTADKKEADLPGILRTLDYLGTPYELFAAAQGPKITMTKLANGCHGFYQGIILTTSELGYTPDGGSYQSAFEPGEQAEIEMYAAQFGVRELVWYGYPSPTFGFMWPSGGVDTTTTPLQAKFTPAGAAVFARVNTANPLTISNAYTYFSTALDASTVPLLVDNAGHVLAASRKFPDGHETLALTFDSNAYLTHNLVLGYDLVSWVTKGLFLGERHVYMSPQVDDLFLANTMWSANTPCGTPIDSTTLEFRLSGADYRAFIAWQKKLRTGALTSNVKLTWAFNGWGADGNYEPDDLKPAVKQNLGEFYFVSHTWDHPNLDNYTEDQTWDEIWDNNKKAVRLGLPADPATLVTPNVSGLKNPSAMGIAYELGVRYIVTDTSQPGYNNPTPNTGMYNPLAPGIFMIPRYPTNLYFNVDTPAAWTAEYNCIYGPKGTNFWGRDLTYQEILNNISDTWVGYLLNGDLDPLMFHQPNARAYDGVHSLLGDLIDLTVAKYRKLVKFPILSPSMKDVGDKMIARKQYNDAGVTAQIVNGVGLVVTAKKAVTVPITGLKMTGAESYAGQYIAHVALRAGQSKTIPIP